jgi:hypothetical protein
MPAKPIDILAGDRARAIAADPSAPQPIFDPTDPRCAGPTTAAAPATTAAAPAAPPDAAAEGEATPADGLLPPA